MHHDNLVFLLAFGTPACTFGGSSRRTNVLHHWLKIMTDAPLSIDARRAALAIAQDADTDGHVDVPVRITQVWPARASLSQSSFQQGLTEAQRGGYLSKREWNAGQATIDLIEPQETNKAR